MTTTNSAYEVETMRVPADLHFAVSQLVAMHDAGWEMCGYAGGADGEKRQFVRVEFRRRPEVSDA